MIRHGLYTCSTNTWRTKLISITIDTINIVAGILGDKTAIFLECRANVSVIFLKQIVEELNSTLNVLRRVVRVNSLSSSCLSNGRAYVRFCRRFFTFKQVAHTVTKAKRCPTCSTQGCPNPWDDATYNSPSCTAQKHPCQCGVGDNE